MINIFSRVTGIKSTHLKLLAFLYKNGKHIEKEIRVTISQEPKNLGISLTNKVKDLCNDNFLTCKKEMEDTRIWSDCPWSWTSNIGIFN